MHILRGLLVPLLVISVIASLTPSASFATPSPAKDSEQKCQKKRGSCKPANRDGVAIQVDASTIFNDRLLIETDSLGSFAIGAAPDSTGNPTSNSWDLSFGWPDSGNTSFTTIRIDGVDHIYGWEGTQLEAPTKINARTSRSAWKLGDIEVTQTLQIGANSHTGQKDAAIIAYTLRNTGAAARDVGSRVMIDTQINQRDDAPFRVPGTGIVTNEIEFTGAAVPDTILRSAPATTDRYLTASTLKSGGATAPDRLVIANWSGLISTNYDYTVSPGTALTDDNAYALYWNPKPLAAGETRTYVTLYGLGSATVNQTAPLAVSLRGPAALGRVWNDYTPNPFDITATISNTGTTTTAGTQLALNLPAGLQLVSGTATQTIGNLAAGQEKLVSWRVRAPLQHSQATLSYSVAASATGVAAKTVSRSVMLADLDATGRGPFAVETQEYRFDSQTYTDILSDRETELWARTYWPKDLSKGPYPMLVFLHGNHGTCGRMVSGVRFDDSREYTLDGVCTGTSPIVTPNHEGYAYLADQLASWGYIVVSINANRGITSGDAIAGDATLVLARGRLVLKHLQLWHQWNTTGTTPASFGKVKSGYSSFKGSLFKGKLDLGNVGMMGHSRGGQGVRAAYKLYRDVGSPWPGLIPGLGIKGIFELAPTDVTSRLHPMLPPPFEADGTAWAVLLPMCDGDVIDLQGVNTYDRMMPYASENPATLKSVYTVWGANHNFYNTEWQITDSDGCVGSADGNTDLFAQYPGSATQRQTGLASMMAFFRANVGIDPSAAYNLNFNPLAALPPLVSTVTRVDRSLSVSPSSTISSVLENFDQSAGTNTAGVANNSANITITHGAIAVTPGVPSGSFNHHDATQRVGAISWTSAGSGNFFQTNWQAAGSGRNISDHATLDFRIARQISALNTSSPTNFSIRLAHGDGTFSDPVALSAYADLKGPVGGCRGIVDADTTTITITRDVCLSHPLLQMARIPLKDFANAKLDQVRGLRFTFDSTATGAIYVGNMVFSRQFEPTAFPRQYVTSGATPFSVAPEPEAQPAPQIAAEIEVYSANGFPIRDAMPVLRIGDQEIVLSRYKDSSTKTLIFSLTAEELAAISEGDPVTLLYGPYAGTQEWLFGRLSKSNLRLPEQLLPTQQAARDLLAALRSQATTTQEQNQIDAALQRLDRTLAPGQWRDATHLEPGSAEQVFDEAQQAVTSLQQLLHSNTGSIPNAVLRNFLRTRVVHVLRGLAALAIDEAAAGQPGLDQARDALARGDSAVLNDQFVSAVQHYRSAWRQAQRATP